MQSYNQKMKFNKVLPKLTIKLKSDREYLYTGWEINQITHNLNTTYYKNELLNSIKSLLENEIDPKNIFVLNSSVKIGQSYDSIKEKKLNLNSKHDLINFYYMGSPIPVIPNDYLLKLFNIFEMYREFYHKYTSMGLNMPKRKDVIEKIVNNTEFYIEFNNLRNYLYEEITKNNLNVVDKVNTNSDLETIKKKRESLFKSLDAKFKSFNQKIVDINEASNFYEKYSRVEDEEKLNLEDNIKAKIYSNKFFETFSAHDRPIIGVYDPSEHNVEILCTDLISIKNFTEDNYRFFQTKQISQNSPLELIVSVGIGFLPSIIKICESLYNNSQIKSDMNNDKKNSDVRKSELLKKIEEADVRISKSENKAEALNKVETIIDEVKDSFYKETLFGKGSYSTKHLKNNKAHSTIENLRRYNDNNLNKTLDDKDIIIESVISEAN